MKPEWLDRSLNSGPHYCLCLTEPQYHAELRRLELPLGTWPPFLKSNATTHILEYKGKTTCIVCMDGKEAAERDPITIAGLLVHEATHIWQQWLEDVGERRHGDEAEAYAIQWLSQNLMWEYVRQTKRRR